MNIGVHFLSGIPYLKITAIVSHNLKQITSQ
uniref:Uncharacterized protein n=1 Tax=Anguilla anguilla TaxID=7936 RepID=A0A0E9SFJ8_ANGAN